MITVVTFRDIEALTKRRLALAQTKTIEASLRRRQVSCVRCKESREIDNRIETNHQETSRE